VGEGGRVKPGRGFFELAFALALVASLVASAVAVVAPFALVLLWALFLATTLWPLHRWLAARLGGRERIAAALTVLLLVVVLIIPITLGVVAVLPSVRAAGKALGDPSAWRLPPPPGWVRELPVAGDPVHGAWSALAADAGEALQLYRPEATRVGGWLVGHVLGLGLTLVQLLAAVVISWPMLAGGTDGVRLARRFAARVGGEDAAGLLDQAARTIRSVSIGVVGTAFALAALQTLGLVAAGVPHAPLLGVLGFVLAMAQLGTSLVWFGAALWLAYDGHAMSAALTAGWGLLINNAIDGVVKAVLIRRGTGLPLTVIFLGVVGGLFTWGFVGVFLGPTLLGLVWTLLRGWLAAAPAADPAGPGGP